MIRVLSVASECAPLVKTGGLADVAGALPGALAGEGVEMRTLLPGYPAVMAAIEAGARTVWTAPRLFGGPARLLLARAAGLKLYALDAPHLFAREGRLYLGPDGADWPDNPERFAALSQVAAEIAESAPAGWAPEVLHLHDWQAGLAAPYLHDRRLAGRVGSLFTVHNIAFQGLAPAGRLSALELRNEGFAAEGFEYWGQISALKAGLVYADRVSTVSPTYAAELTRPEFGMGLDGVLRARGTDFSGILNGIDLAAWTPPYKTPRGKARHTRALRAELGLPDAPGPLCVVISRLTSQKGLDMLLAALPRLLDEGGQLALLGTGEPALERAFRSAAAADPRVSATIGYDEAFARRLIAGGEAILVPSRFEPCGLTQLYGLRYGTVPLVAYTGGLVDTVIPATAAGLAAGVATGLQVYPITPDGLSRGFTQLCALYRDRPTWERMMRNAMAHPVGWEASAPRYASLFAEIAASKAAR